MSGHNQVLQELGLNVELHDEVLKYIDRTFQQTVGTQKGRPKGIDYFDNVLRESHGDL